LENRRVHNGIVQVPLVEVLPVPVQENEVYISQSDSLFALLDEEAL